MPAYKKPQISCSLAALLVSDLERSKAWYRDALGCEVTDWWVIRDGLTGLALKILQAADPKDVRPNPLPQGWKQGWDVYVYTNGWGALDALYDEFKSKGVTIVREPWIDPSGGPWKEFVISDPDGYRIAFGDVEQSHAPEYRGLDLEGTVYENCSVRNMEICDCDISGLKINGVLIEDLLKKAAST